MHLDPDFWLLAHVTICSVHLLDPWQFPQYQAHSAKTGVGTQMAHIMD